MQSIRHQMEISAPLDDVFQAVATREGVASWWTTDTRGTDGQGGKLEFWFGHDKAIAVVEITEVTPPSRVAWKVLEGADEWVGHTIAFDVRAGNNKTIVNFTHEWDEGCDFMHHCSTAWSYYLFSLRAALESDTGRPWPENMHKPLEVAP